MKQQIIRDNTDPLHVELEPESGGERRVVDPGWQRRRVAVEHESEAAAVVAVTMKVRVTHVIGISLLLLTSSR